MIIRIGFVLKEVIPSTANESILPNGYFDSPAKRSVSVIYHICLETDHRNHATQEKIHFFIFRNASNALLLIKR